MNTEAFAGLLYVSSGDQLTRCEALVGKTFYRVSAEGDRLVVSCKEGNYFINSDDQIQQFGDAPLPTIAAGSGFLVGINQKNRLYSWGMEGDGGQLGQGANVKKVFEPLEVNFNAQFVDVSCGESFAVGLDNLGYAYSWGEVRIIDFKAKATLTLCTSL
jgi:alpha-tubulin suppressor-like RCC1 family protein